MCIDDPKYWLYKRFIIFCTVKFCIFLYVYDLFRILSSCDKLMDFFKELISYNLNNPEKTHKTSKTSLDFLFIELYKQNQRDLCLHISQHLQKWGRIGEGLSSGKKKGCCCINYNKNVTISTKCHSHVMEWFFTVCITWRTFQLLSTTQQS
jgi:hypothetical protein